MPTNFSRASLAEAPRELRRRVAIAWETNPEPVARPPFRRLAGELDALREPLRRAFRQHPDHRAARPRTVMLLPGFATHPLRMRYLAHRLEAAGHTVKRWGLGFNLGPNAERIEFLERRLADLAARHGEPVVLVGWSLGGLFARELAKRQPENVAKVITMGSPFSYSPRANNVWRAYQFVTGHRVDELPVEAVLHEKPPVETVALWSPRDGMVHPRAARGRAGERDRAVALHCTHIGFSYDPEVVRTVLAELDAS